MRRESAPQPYLKFLSNFLLEDLVTSVTARIHTVVLAFGGVFYIYSIRSKLPFVHFIGIHF